MTQEAGLTDRIVRGSRTISSDDLSDDVVLIAKTCVLDWIGCALAGAAEPVTRILTEEAVNAGAKPAASIVCQELRTSPRWASSINATSAHALDYDDTLFISPSHPIHPTTPVLSAALALAERDARSGADLLAAFVAGVQAECAIGAALGPEHYEAGWHSTATLGTFGSTAAVAHLLRLDESKWRHAFGIAATRAGGLKSVFGSMTKPLQVGRAAASGILAAALAARGMTSDDAVIESPQGFAATHNGKPDASERDGYWISETVFKYHASCYLTHSAIEAVQEMARRQAIDVARVASVDVVVPAGHLAVCNIQQPATGLEGKFSLRATVAMALLGVDTADPASYTDGRMRSNELTDVRDKVSVLASNTLTGAETTVTVHLDDTTTSSLTVDTGVPAKDPRRQWTAIARKFDRLAQPALGPARSRALYEAVADLEHIKNIADVMELCRPAR